ncbi:sigma-70 family RNA polymerase sigma factor [Jeotgalibacillus sp. R-1-5s-1]|uniref:sigma-70 family RNA polymerase sigma factor n=1 Tax=Jeotgalibacillus sp. R-1-5s-1 TaxID=2555897 RepID=UPI00106D4C99|nr:sigma-70 family RNA polymerase sigma factor [Jeotgalibacillus sp. R-1-5s-1]TFE01357.1 sigma-70 family RNA polymerase sigma factor [Jeotgalibacillus sp. R-1-5s-1]
MDLVSLAEKAIKKDDDAFIAMIREVRTDLYKTAYAYLKNEDDALEAIQEVTFRAYRSIGKLKEPAYCKTWLIRITINVCQDELKKRKQIIRTEVNDQLFVSEEDLLFMETNEALEQLSFEERELLHMKYICDLTIREVAESLEVSEGTIKTRLYKALGRLRKWMEKGDDHDVRGRRKATK